MSTKHNINDKVNWTARGPIYKNLIFLAFLAGLGVMYIANSHYAERNQRKIQALKNELNEAKWEYRKIKHEIMHNSTQTELQKEVESLDLKLDDSLPKLIKAPNS